MDPGVIALAGIFTLAAGCALWNVLHRRGVAARVAGAGFAPCESEAPALQRTWCEVTRSDGADREINVSGCVRRAGSSGFLYRFHVAERHTTTPASDSSHVGARHDAYLLDLREPAAIARAPVTLFVLPVGNALARRLVEGAIALGAPGEKLEVAQRPTTRAILSAYSARAGKLDEVVPHAVQERIAKAAEHGIFEVHLAGGKAGFAVLPGHREIEREVGYLAEWS